METRKERDPEKERKEMAKALPPEQRALYQESFDAQVCMIKQYHCSRLLMITKY